MTGLARRLFFPGTFLSYLFEMFSLRMLMVEDFLILFIFFLDSLLRQGQNPRYPLFFRERLSRAIFLRRCVKPLWHIGPWTKLKRVKIQRFRAGLEHWMPEKDTKWPSLSKAC